MDIKDEILRLASKKKKFKTSDVLKEIKNSVSRQYIHQIMQVLIKEGQLLKGGTTSSAFYVSAKNASLVTKEVTLRLKRENLEEHMVFTTLTERATFMKSLSGNVSSILFYAFTEMLNNAIEHSKSKYVEIMIKERENNIVFVVNDFGIGVFRNIVKQRGLKNELEAMQDLMKGKTTTQPHSHTGEGIFFTSKVSDKFLLESYNYKLFIDNTIKDVFFEELKPSKRGTRVTFTISSKTKRHLNDIFSQFVTEPGEVGFDKTKILVRLFTSGTVYISRSQARRLTANLDKYKTIVLDFERVTTVGQAFADEIFRVFKNRHPDIHIEAINMVEPVQFMIERAEHR